MNMENTTAAKFHEELKARRLLERTRVLSKKQWDLIVVDEAHEMFACQHGPAPAAPVIGHAHEKRNGNAVPGIYLSSRGLSFTFTPHWREIFTRH